MKNYYKASSFLLMCFLLICAVAANVHASSLDSAKLTILHLNDTHGRTQAEPYISQLAMDLREKGENVLVLDAGDRLHGQTVTNLSKGEAMVGIMNAVGYNAMVPGNHDFTYGVDRLIELSETMNFPLLAANVKRNGEDIFKPYEVFRLNGVSVGVFGIVTPETISASDPRIMTGLTFDDPAQTAKQMVKALKDEGCDIIIALAHLGDDKLSDPQNKSDALADVDGIDVVIDGHSHTLLENGRVAGNTFIAQTGEYGENIGMVEITAVGTKSAEVIAIPTDDEETILVKNEAILMKIAEEEAKIEPVTSAVVGNTPVKLIGEKEIVRTQETNLANLITDSMLHATGADIAFLSGGNIRASIEAGDITMGQALTTLPYSNVLVTVELSGANVLEMLEHGISGYPEPVGEHIQVSGIRFEFDPEAQPMDRVVSVTMADGSPFDEHKTYKVATIDFLKAGGDGYTMLENGKNNTYYQGDVEAFVGYLATNPPISAGPENRIAIASGEKAETQPEQSPQSEQPAVPAPTSETAPVAESENSTANTNAYIYILIFAVAAVVIAYLIMKRKKSK